MLRYPYLLKRHAETDEENRGSALVHDINRSRRRDIVFWEMPMMRVHAETGRGGFEAPCCFGGDALPCAEEEHRRTGVPAGGAQTLDPVRPRKALRHRRPQNAGRHVDAEAVTKNRVGFAHCGSERGVTL